MNQQEKRELKERKKLFKQQRREYLREEKLSLKRQKKEEEKLRRKGRSRLIKYTIRALLNSIVSI